MTQHPSSAPRPRPSLNGSPHPSTDELAEAEAGLLDPARQTLVADHVEGCAACAHQLAGLREVSDQLARTRGERAVAMPGGVVARLDQVLIAEQARRSFRDARSAGPPEPLGSGARTARPALTPAPAAKRTWSRIAGVALAAAATAAAVGGAGYAVSAAAGLNEPTATTPVQVQSADLAAQARALAEARDLSAYPLSRAWRCARTVAAGRITGIAPAVVDGSPALLVYTERDGSDWVTVVTGCPRPGAVARSSVPLSS